MKGFFSQGVSFLTNGEVTTDDIRTVLARSGIEIVNERPGGSEWALWGPTLVIPYRPEVNGYAAIDIVDRPWPDTMGDPKSDSMLFAAWSTGHFGPFAYPGCLERAQQHAWAWEPARTIADGHRGFIRLRITYGFGADSDDPVMPADNNAVDELMFLGRVAIAILNMTGVICYFNPNGEVLRNCDAYCDEWNSCRERALTPLPLWTNIRFYKLNEAFRLMDTVGNSQLDLRDVESVFPIDRYSPKDVHGYLRNVTLYLIDLDRELVSGETIDGPGDQDLSWNIEALEQGLIGPPRRVLRLFPRDCSKAVEEAISNAR